MENYDDIRKLLKPRREIKASPQLHDRIETILEEKKHLRIVKRIVLGGIGLGLAASVLLLIFLPQQLSATDILQESLSAMRNNLSFQLEVDVRTNPYDNFETINHKLEFVRHSLYVDFVDSTKVWKVDREGRSILKAVDSTYVWFNKFNIGYKYKNLPEDSSLYYLSLFITPYNIIENELKAVSKRKDTDYRIKKIGNEIQLYIHSKPNDNYENSYLLNLSVNNSDNIRQYSIDANNHRLKNASVGILVDGKEFEVIRLKDIKYGKIPENELIPPKNVDFYIKDKSEPSGLPVLNETEAAILTLRAFKDWDQKILEKVLDPVHSALIRESFEGSVLLSIGEPFMSGKSKIIFVPYKIMFRDGIEHLSNLALVKNSSGRWVVTGGL